TFTYKETNTGTDPLKSVAVSGSFCGTATFVSSTNSDTTDLDPGQTWTFTCSKVVTATVTDNASATGTDTVDGLAAPPESNQAVVTVTNPTTSLTETVSGSPVRTGTSVTFTYKETNTGTDPLKWVAVSGSFCGTATFVSSTNSDTTDLDPGQTWTFTCSKVVTATVTDNASATGTATVDGLPAPPESASASVTVTNPPALSITKTADATSVSAGSNVGFTITVSNSGTAGTGTATSVTLNDPLPAGSGIDWSISPAYSGPGTCAVSGAVGSQVLSCS